MIKYVKGDLFDHLDGFSGYTIVPHIVNNLGIFGSGFVVPLSKHFPSCKKEYLKKWESFALGQVMLVKCKNIYIAHMFAQDGISSKSVGQELNRTTKPIRYTALVKCLEEIQKIVQNSKTPCRIMAPKFGSLRAGGNWDLIEELINEIWSDIDVTIYDYS